MTRFAVIGCGRMGACADKTASRWATSHLWLPLSHASALRATEGAEIVGYCDVDGEKARTASEMHGGQPWFTNVGEMLQTVKPDAVSIATRTRERREIIEKCIDSGVRGIFCEKPLSLTLEDSDAIYRKVVDHGVSFILGTRRRFMPVYQRALELFWNNSIGEPQTILISFGSAPLLWWHPHTLDLAGFFANDAGIVSIEGRLDYPAGTWNGPVLDCDPIVRYATICFANGMVAHITRAGGIDVELCGSGGRIAVRGNGLHTEVRSACKVSSEVEDAGTFLSTVSLATPPEVSGTVQSFRLLMESMNGGKCGIPGPSIALRNTELILGLVESDRAGGRRVEWPLARNGLMVTGRLGTLYP